VIQRKKESLARLIAWVNDAWYVKITGLLRNKQRLALRINGEDKQYSDITSRRFYTIHTGRVPGSGSGPLFDVCP